jgi:acetoin utilization deacetylase AcuC-like enzyme
MASARFIYSPDYYCDIGDHVFRTDKYRLLRDRIVESGLASPGDFLVPEPATRAQLELAHTPRYVSDLYGGRHTPRTIHSEMPINRAIVDAFALGAGGSILASRVAARDRTMTMNLAGGFHHAFADWAEGFCYINDVAVAIKCLRAEGLAERAMVVDCDLHQGNGTAEIFSDEAAVFTFSIHQESIYPLKRRSDLDMGLSDFCTREDYLSALRDNLLPALGWHAPELVLYVAGADPYEKDQLGTLQLSVEDLRRRDDIVIGACAKRGVPVAAVLAGGYAPDVEDTVRIHYGTACSLIEYSQFL